MMSTQTLIPLDLNYWHRLTDDTGIFQHAKFGLPDRRHGYTTDDNARGLIAAVMWHHRDLAPKAVQLMYTYLSFVYHAQNDEGSFKNFMNYERRFVEEVGSEDSFGRALWAVGYTLSDALVPKSLKHACWAILSRGLDYAQGLRSPRAKAYALIGLSYVAQSADWATVPASVNSAARIQVRSAVDYLGRGLEAQYHAYRRSDWHWFEDSVTYGNAVLPWSLFMAAEVLTRSDWTGIARESLTFLSALTRSPEGYFQPIGCRGWLTRGGTPARYDEQPIEAAEMLMAFQSAYRSLGNPEDHDGMERCYQWYLGKNSQAQSLIDPETFGCYDGIEAHGLNLNQGSESILSYVIAHFAMADE